MIHNKVKLYAKALAEVLSKKGIDEEGVINNFVKILVKSGQEKRAKEIVALAENLILEKSGKKKIILETARKISPKQREALKAVIKEGDVVQEKISPEIIAGIKIIINNERQFDASMLKNLQQIYEPRNNR